VSELREFRALWRASLVIGVCGTIVAVSSVSGGAAPRTRHRQTAWPRRVCNTVRVPVAGKRTGRHRKQGTNRMRICVKRLPVDRAKLVVHTHSGGFKATGSLSDAPDEGAARRLRVGRYRPLHHAARVHGIGGVVAPPGTNAPPPGGPLDVSIGSTSLIPISATPERKTDLGAAFAVGEPSVADAGRDVMYAFNWDAVYSTDGGQTFREIDPHTTFPADAGGFGCDQVVQYDPSTKVFIWALQYHCKGNGVNLIRIAWASAPNLERYGPHAWSWFDLSPTAIAGRTNTYLDQPRLAFSPKFLYISLRQGALTLDKRGTPNGGNLEHTAVVRIPRSSFANPLGRLASLPYGWALLDPISLRVAQNVQGPREYFVGHNDTSKLTVAWVNDDSNSIYLQDIDSPTIATGGPTLAQQQRNWTSKTPGGDNMLDHLGIGQQTAVTGVTQGGDGTLWAAWSEGRDSPDGTRQYPQPHIGVAELQPIPGHAGFTLQAQNEYVGPSVAYALPDLATDASGEVAFDLVWGGGGLYFANHAVGFLRSRDHRSNAFDPVADQLGTSDSPFPGNPFGDYETVRPIAPPYGDCLAAAGIVNQKDAFGNNIGFPVFTIFSRPGVKCPASFKNLPVVALPPAK
jgi:hypothetical protein